jgi:hypothetical protein
MPLIRLFLDIALFNKGPRDVPASKALLAFVIAANLGVGLALSLLETAWLDSFIQSVVGILMLAGFLWIALYFSGKLSRLLQTATAAFGCDTLISAIAVPFLLWSRLAGDSGGVVEVLITLLVLWQVAVVGHILRHALSASFMAGFGLAFMYTVASFKLIMALFPGAD